MTPHESSETPSGPGRQFDLTISDDDAGPVVRMVNLIISEALISGAQRVHLNAGTLDILFFRGGEWLPAMKVPAMVLGPLINRLRVMAVLDRFQGNRRQEGTIEVVGEGAPVTIGVVVQFTEAGDEEAYLELPCDEGQ